MIDIEALKAKLAEYDDARPRCPQKVARTVNCAPDYLTTKHAEYHDYDLTTYAPCCRPEGHEGECRNSRLILGWPGYVTITALVAEVERLNEQCLEHEAEACGRMGHRDGLSRDRGPFGLGGQLDAAWRRGWDERSASVSEDHAALVAEVEHLRVQSATFRRLLAEVVIERDALQEQIDAASVAAFEAELCEEK